ncbi:Ileal sodium/bile acid cotransporter [Holothuria leucospilota]|uniref:Ileal sodium/bile acid cotransporter n=1 Tax=Holothuria leucospilota TaxID=206669 RepID=A0A9Q1BM85_HOLLE|nr:Ileal sodium/bile acid cotransporter [Holothuria leucospilota]
METEFPSYLLEEALTTSAPDVIQPTYVIVLKRVNKIILTSLLAFIMVAMGCVVTVNDFKVVLRRPIGAFIGFGCQFVILPLTAFTLGHILSLKPAFALGMLITATSPGGVTSNLYTYWADGDVCLSIVMTTVSTAAALGMMPFNLWLYSRSWTDSSVAVIPYSNIFVSLVLIFIPVVIGMMIRWKMEKLAGIVTKIGSVSGLLAIGINLIINGIINPGMFASPWALWLAAIILPFCGYSFGFFIAWLLRQKPKQCRTISFETGAQNVAIALSLIAVTFDGSPLFYDLFTYPSIYGFSLITEALALVAIYKVYAKMYKKQKETENSEFERLETRPGDKLESDVQSSNGKNPVV